MIFYAELNEQNVVVGIKMVKGELDLPNHVQIDSMDGEYMYKKYENDMWSKEKYLPDMGAIQQTEFEKLKAANEALKQSQAEQDEAIMLLMLGGM